MSSAEAIGKPSLPGTDATAPKSASAKPGLWSRIKGKIILIEQDFAVLKLSILSVLGTLIVAYFQDLSAYQDKVSAQAKEDLTAATDTFTQTSNTLSAAVTLQSLLFYDFFHAVDLKVGDDKNALTSKNAQDLYKPYEDAAAALHENVDVVARQVEINLDWASDVGRDPATVTTFGVDPISTSYLGTVGFDCDDDMPKFGKDDHAIVKTNGKKSLTIDWYSAKHNVLTIAYCFEATHKAWMETVREWASQSSLSKDQIAAFFSAGMDKKLQDRLDSEVVRVNDFMSRAMNEIEGIRVKYRPTSFYCDLPGVSQAMDFFGKLEPTDKSANAGNSKPNPCTPIRLRV
jgi:hypothetical protein